jgi:hypothetical protein
MSATVTSILRDEASLFFAAFYSFCLFPYLIETNFIVYLLLYVKNLLIIICIHFILLIKFRSEGGIRICVNLRKLNVACLHDPFPTPFTNEFLEIVGGQEAYSFKDGFSGYHHIKIATEDRYKTTFSTE